MIFLPLLILGMYHLFIGDSRKWPIAAFAFTGLLQSHLISTELSIGFGLLFALCFLKNLKSFKRILHICLAAGFTVRTEHIPALAQRLKTAAAQAVTVEEPVSVLEVDAVVQSQDLTVEAVESLELLEPCGTGNPRPVLMLTGASVQTMAQVGRGRHLKLRLEHRGNLLDAIFFSADAAELGITTGSRIDVAFYPQINQFRGMHSVQLQVIDLRPAVTRAQAERAVYEKYRKGCLLTPDEARTLMPSRAEFVALWRYLERQSAGRNYMEATPAHIARGAASAVGQRETLTHTLLCLDVFAERGLICLSRQADLLTISINHLEHKVDLEQSAILCRLRELAGTE
jgi:single-stranded-DNA-specific exonuclease